MNQFDIYLTFDIDQDFAPNTSDYYNRSKADFKTFKERFSSVIDSLNHIPFSVFLRADNQIESIYGSYDYLLKENKIIVDKILNNNGEINWHAHLYTKNNNNWFLERDDEKLAELFEENYKNVRKIKNINSDIIRLGECVMNNNLMRVINSKNIKIDSSALPFRKRDDIDKFFDWKITSNKFYFPSKLDYRVQGTDNYNLIEVPLTTIKMKAPYDKESIHRYFNLSFKSNILFENFSEYVKNNNHLVIITHPSEILINGTHDLISFNLETFKYNLNYVVEKVKLEGKNPVFKKISSIKYDK